ncbi:MAG: efflux RND transporter periplasmic adaptor subunit [Candidatus Omnitrophota bacterium]|nr:efflux RND transporter periplasmic adaptor subunit [Candidatus Omnitrophota bacterium]
MKRKKTLIFIFVVTGVLLTTGFFVSSMVSKDRASAEAKNPSKPVYYCPMHTDFTSDKPGDCIICGMKLVKKEEKPKAAGSSSSGAELAPEKDFSEICILHNCTMKNCPMHVKVKLKPGERMICPVCGEVISTANGKVVEINQPAAAGKKEPKILYYRNPMDPAVTSPVPMKDSMGMDYAPVYEEIPAPGAGQGVYISPEKQQRIGIKTEAVKKMHLAKVVRAFGKSAYDPELYVAQEEYLQTLKTVQATKNSPLTSVVEQTQSLLAASEKKLLLLGMNKEEITGLATQGLAQENLYLPSGQNKIWIYVDVYEYEIGLIKPGQKVDVEAVAYPGEIFSGNVVSINPVLEAASRTNQVRVEVENSEGKLKPEMFINAKIQVDLGEKLAVPETAVLDTGLRKIVYLSEPGDVLESREVIVGQKAEGYYEILSGLNEGDVVITSGNFLVDSESQLKGATKHSEHQHGQ